MDDGWWRGPSGREKNNGIDIDLAKQTVIDSLSAGLVAGRRKSGFGSPRFLYFYLQYFYLKSPDSYFVPNTFKTDFKSTSHKSIKYESVVLNKSTKYESSTFKIPVLVLLKSQL